MPVPRATTDPEREAELAYARSMAEAWDTIAAARTADGYPTSGRARREARARVRKLEEKPTR